MKKRFFVLFIALAMTFGGFVLSGCMSSPVKSISQEEVDMQKFSLVRGVDDTYIYRITNDEFVLSYSTSSIEVYYSNYLALPAGRYLLREHNPIETTFTYWRTFMRVFDFEAGTWYKVTTNLKDRIIVQATETKDLFIDPTNGYPYKSGYHSEIYYVYKNNPSSTPNVVSENHISDNDLYLYFVYPFEITKIDPVADAEIKIFKSDIEVRKK